MSRKGMTLVAVLFAVFVLILGGLTRVMSGRSDKHRDDVALEAAEANVPGSGPSVERRPRADAPGKSLARLRTYLQGTRTPVPRFSPAAPHNAISPDAAVPRAHRRLASKPGKMTDRTSDAGGANSERLKVELSRRIDAAEEAAQKCLGQWAEEDSSLDAGVTLSFTVDKRGLEEVWIRDRSDVPNGPLACISNSVYPIDWGGLTDKPIEITVPVRYAGGDSGT